MIKTMNRWLLATLVLAMAACASTKQSGDDVPIEDRQPSEFSTENGGDGFSVNGIGDNGDVIGSETSGIGSEGAASLAALEDPDSPLAERIIYFAVDSNVIGNEYTAMIEAHARFLAENPDVMLFSKDIPMRVVRVNITLLLANVEPSPCVIFCFYRVLHQARSKPSVMVKNALLSLVKMGHLGIRIVV